MSEYLEAMAIEGARPERSLELYRQVYQKQGQSFWVNYRLACAEWRVGRYQKALEHLSVCLEAYPENARLLIQRAGLLCKVDQPALRWQTSSERSASSQRIVMRGIRWQSYAGRFSRSSRSRMS